MKKKLIGILASALVLAMVILIYPIRNAEALPAAGILRGNPESVGAFNIPVEWTDGNIDSYTEFDWNVAHTFTFTKPQNITGYFFHASNATKLSIYSNDVKLATISGSSARDIPYTQASYNSVTKLVLTLLDPGTNTGWVKEIDIEATSVSSTPTPIPTSAPDIPNQGDKAVLVIYLTSGLTKEYDLSALEINNFVTWYTGLANGTGTKVYTFNKNENLANYTSRIDYIAYDKIEMFEINKYQN